MEERMRGGRGKYFILTMSISVHHPIPLWLLGSHNDSNNWVLRKLLLHYDHGTWNKLLKWLLW